jgi:hypothetical protein
VLRFVGEDGRSPEGLAQRKGNGSRQDAAVHGPVASPVRRLGAFVDPFRRSRERGLRAELVSQEWSPSEELQVELDRSRRFGRRFALVRISPRRGFEGGWNAVRELAYELGALVRRIDRVWIEGASVYLLLPECDRTRVEALLERLRDPLSRLLAENERPEVSSAVFPDDGMTRGALMDSLAPETHGLRVVTSEHPSTPAA